MKTRLSNIFYSFPIQLFILHFRKFQVLLVFWYLLGSTINSGFMKTYGADALFLSPEYLGSVNWFSAFIVGIAWGVFVMSWNVTTFILHSKRCKFLATTTNPFLKYCTNNALLPIAFLAFYFSRMYHFNEYLELMPWGKALSVMGGILAGFIVVLLFSFGFFFGAEKQIQRTLSPIVAAEKHLDPKADPSTEDQVDQFGMRVSYFITTGFRFKKVRSVAHYSQNFLDLVFKRHHFTGIISILLAFSFLILVGFFMDNQYFQVPAAASIFIFFAVMVAVIGSLSYFLQSWSLPFFIVLVLVIDEFYKREIIDPRNKAYGLNYANRSERPAYDRQTLLQLCQPEKISADRSRMLQILEKWKSKIGEDKPIMIFVNVSGGGLRSGTFVMNTLQQLDSITGGRFMKHTFLMSGASGGMLSAAYYRELYRNNVNGNTTIKRNDPKYTERIAQDLLNPVFSSMIARDLFVPVQKFYVNGNRYVKDRGYAFEQKLLENSGGLLNVQLKDYSVDESSARIPLIIFNSTISRDGRKMMIGTQPVSFLMKPGVYANDSSYSPDAVDFAALFAKQDPLNVRVLSALRMNATFPYVLPNVWLPSRPVIDVMDAGLRDNFGQETTLRFIENFREWLMANTGGVIIIQMRDRLKDNWQQPFETGSITDILIKPATMLQHNWYKLQDYGENSQYSYLHKSMDSMLHQVTFMYLPKNENQGAALNFHLTEREKRDIIASFHNGYNQAALSAFLQRFR